MGKGKKRDKNNKEISRDTAPESHDIRPTATSGTSAAASLSGPSAVPSTSDGSSAADATPDNAEDNDAGGLGLPGRNRKKKLKTAPQPQLPQAMSVCSSPAHVPVPPQQATQEVEEEAEGLGLGLGKSKSRSKKKRNATQGASVSQPASTAAVPTQAVEGPSSSGAVSAPGGAIRKDSWMAEKGSSSSTLKNVESGPVGSKKSQEQKKQSAWSSPPMTVLCPSSAGTSADKPQPSTSTSESFAKLKIRREEKPPLPSLRHIPPRIRTSLAVEKTISRPVDILVNYLPMKFRARKIYRYDVGFRPEKPKQKLLAAYKIAKERLFPSEIIAYDQVKNCYATKPLLGRDDERLVTLVEIEEENDKTLKFEVTFQSTGVVDLEVLNKYMQSGTSLSPPTEAIQCIDVILKQGTLEDYVRSGRQYFIRPMRPRDLGDGLEMWTGLFQSAIFTSGSYVNIDVAHKGFPRHQTVLEAMHRDFRIDLNRQIEQQRNNRGVESFLEFIKGLRVSARLVGGTGERTRVFMCNGLAEPPGTQTFTFTDHESNQQVKMTVGEYFRTVKGYKIQYPHLNCMWVGPRDRGIFFPMELLEISYGQVRNRQLNERQLSTMVREAATPPDQRKQKIEEVIKTMNYTKNAYFKHFGLEISEEFIRLNAKVLQPPVLNVGGKYGVVPKNGVWNANTLYKPEALQAWGLISIELNPTECNGDQVIQMIMNEGRQLGMRVAEPSFQRYDVRIEELRRVLLHAYEKKIKLLIIIISRKGRDTYPRVKQMAECQVGILTQCIKEVTATTRFNRQTARNVLLKINSKLMGINQVLDACSTPPCLKNNDAMIIGADVTHPAPEQKTIPSIAAVTASMDKNFFVYNIALSIQTPKQEMIVQFGDMMLEHLKCYRDQRGALPKKLYIFRDGVSEGQFSHVMAGELRALHHAYEKLVGPNGPKPEVLFMLVQKRHHTRFFNPVDKFSQYNVNPGTVVDTHIVHPRELDYYLVSHSAIKGTARPTRYHAVCNDGNVSDSEVEQVAYYLCHLYARCTRAVSYPTPTYYAHLACLRARALTHGQNFLSQELERQPVRLRVLDRMLEHSRMFFV